MKCLLPIAVALAGAASVFAQPAASVEASLLALPAVGQGELRVLSASMLEVSFVTAPAEGAIPPAASAAAKSDYKVTVDDQPVALAAIGFKRRAVYAPLKRRDLRV